MPQQPHLPPNSWAITPPPQMARTAEGAWQLFHGRMFNEKFFAEVRRELQILRDWDTYDRRITLSREAAKGVLRRFLDQEQ